MSGLGEVLTFMGAVQMCRVRQGREHPAVLRCRELGPARALSSSLCDNITYSHPQKSQNEVLARGTHCMWYLAVQTLVPLFFFSFTFSPPSPAVRWLQDNTQYLTLDFNAQFCSDFLLPLAGQWALLPNAKRAEMAPSPARARPRASAALWFCQACEKRLVWNK